MVQVMHRGVVGIGEDESSALAAATKAPAESAAMRAYRELNPDPYLLTYITALASGLATCPDCGGLVALRSAANGADRLFCHDESRDLALYP